MKKLVLTNAVALGFCCAVNAQTSDAQAPKIQSSTRLPQNDFVTLRLNLKKGDNFLVTQDWHIITTNVFAPKGQHKSAKLVNKNIRKCVVKLSVLWFNRDATVQIRLVFLDIQSDWIVVLSDKNSQSFPNFGINPLVGQSLEMNVSPQGAVSNVHGWDKIIDKMSPSELSSSETPTDNSARTPTQKREQLKAHLTNSYLHDLMQQLFIPLPNYAISPGFSWQRENEIAPSSNLSTNYTLQSRANGLAFVVQNGSLKLSDDKEPNEPPMHGILSGKIVLDETTGFPVTIEQNLRFFKTKTQQDKRDSRIYSLSQITIKVEKQ